VSARLAGELSAYRIPKAPLAASGTAPTG
jgi:hypothetical protein